MNEKQYVRSIIKKIKCSRHKKKEIKKQLLADILAQKEQGESLEEIFSRMGSAKEIATGFNETISEQEQQHYQRNQILKAAAIVLGVVILVFIVGFWMLPKSLPIEKSHYFDQTQVEEAMKTTVEQIDTGNWRALCENAIPQMQEFLGEDAIKEIKGTVAEDWGERKNFGSIYLTELVQEGVHYVVGEITVSYEKVSVIYRLTYDTEMKLAGLYVR